MTELDKGQKANHRGVKYLWLGYGSYGGQPNLQTPVGNIRDPKMFEEFSKESKTEYSTMPFFMGAIIAVIGLMFFAALLAWGISLVVR